MRFEVFKEAVTAKAQALGLTDYELYYSRSESVSVDVFRQEVRSFSSSLEGGVCFRCLLGGRMGYASTEDLSAESAEEIVLRAAENAKVLESDDPEFLGEGGASYAEVCPPAAPQLSAAEMTALALDLQKALYAADPRVIDGTSARVIRASDDTAIFNSRGLDVSQHTEAAVALAAPVVTDGKEMSNSYKLSRLKDGLDFSEAVEKSVKEATAKLGAGVAPTGTWPVVFSSSAMASLLGVFSGIFSGENAARGMSLLKGREGEIIASPAVTLTDDPFYKDSIMPSAFDAEGTPTSRKDLIDAGKLTTLLHNLKTAASAGCATTGNAAKSSYNSPVAVRPFTLVLQPGRLTADELLAKAGNGVYIDFLGGLHAGANPISGDFSLQSGGFLIENGKKTQAVRSFTVSGNFYQLLKQIDDLSDTAELSGFGSAHDFACPDVLVSGLSIAGK